jgi:hypothetical protein
MTASMASTLFFSNDESLYLAPLLDQVLAALAACPSPLTGSTYRTLLSLSLLFTWQRGTGAYSPTCVQCKACSPKTS